WAVRFGVSKVRKLISFLPAVLPPLLLLVSFTEQAVKLTQARSAIATLRVIIAMRLSWGVRRVTSLDRMYRTLSIRICRRIGVSAGQRWDVWRPGCILNPEQRGMGGRMAVTDEAIEQIKEMIVSGRLRPGQRLPKEADLAAQLGLSRNSLREA